MNDTSGISVCFGSIQDPNLFAHAKAALKQMKAKWTENIEIDTTHFVCQAAGPAENNYNPTAEYLKAVQLSLPIVQPQWILACQIEKKLVPVSSFQLGADTPHKYQPQGKLAEEDEQVPSSQATAAALVPKSTTPETGNGAGQPSTDEKDNETDTATQGVATAAIQSQGSGPNMHPETASQQPNSATDASARTASSQAGNESPPSAPRSPKPEADGKLDRTFKFPVSSSPANDKAGVAAAESVPDSGDVAKEDNEAMNVEEAIPGEDKPAETEPLVEDPKANDDDFMPVSQTTADPVSASTEDQPLPDPTTSNPPRPETKKTDPDVDVAARQWLSGQKPVDASGEEEDHSSKVLDDVLVKKAAAQAEKEAAAVEPTPVQPVENEEEPRQSDAAPVIEVQKDHGQVVKVPEESTLPVDQSQTEATPTLVEPVEDVGEGEDANDEEDQTPADSAVPTPSQSPAPVEGETPVTGGNKKKKNKKKNKK
ncbi:hypothetical protein QFC22_000978 [Naganishia vaughanmartiniae]|uniref:Uncharacterized protein n=1 Tax=Naganishia vaughanmartiniae TaxID=1424756 RepID=A0ACC2XMD7_9TREE|nr:hypothetical protein QFC22_000978 [Naganishia vaughanmartiniae]